MRLTSLKTMVWGVYVLLQKSRSGVILGAAILVVLYRLPMLLVTSTDQPASVTSCYHSDALTSRIDNNATRVSNSISDN